MSVKIVAEIGINHNGDLEKAKRMIRKSAEAGADVVKFQKRTIDLCYTPEFLDSPRESPWGSTQRAQKEGLEFSVDQYRELVRYAELFPVEVMVSVWDTKSAEEMRWLNPAVKIPSAMAVNLLLLKVCERLYDKIYVSIGGCTDKDIERVQNIVGPKLEQVQCVAAYPAPIEYSHLSEIRYVLYCQGWSSHIADHDDPGIIDVAAVGAGARYIERHVSESHDDYGSDQKMSLTFEQFALAVKRIRLAELACLPQDEKKILDCEVDAMRKLREHLL